MINRRLNNFKIDQLQNCLGDPDRVRRVWQSPGHDGVAEYRARLLHGVPHRALRGHGRLGLRRRPLLGRRWHRVRLV